MDDLTQAFRLLTIALSFATFFSLMISWPNTLGRPLKERMVFSSLMAFTITLGYSSAENIALDLPGGPRVFMVFAAMLFAFIAISLPDKPKGRR